MKTYSETTRKNLASVILGPLAIVPAMVLMGVASHFLFPQMSATTDWREVFNVYGLIGLFIAYGLTVFLALPLVVVLQKRGVFNLISVLAAALGIAVLLCVVMSAELLTFVYFGYFAISVALGCWWVHKRV